MDVREHPNYAREAMTIEEAEKHATLHQTVSAFRLLKAIDEREVRIKELEATVEKARVAFHDYGIYPGPIFGEDR